MMFSLAFLILFGGRRWWLPIPYMVLIIYPGMVLVMGVHSLSDLVLAAVGHAAFGVTLGVVSWAYLGQVAARVTTTPEPSSITS